jgi:hypothetical protein
VQCLELGELRARCDQHDAYEIDSISSPALLVSAARTDSVKSNHTELLKDKRIKIF